MPAFLCKHQPRYDRIVMSNFRQPGSTAHRFAPAGRGTGASLTSFAGSRGVRSDGPSLCSCYGAQAGLRDESAVTIDQ